MKHIKLSVYSTMIGSMQQILYSATRPAIISTKPRSIVDYTQKEVQVLYKLYSIFPLDPFPTIITIMPDTVSIVNNLLGLSQKILTVNLDDIFTVEVDSGFFFADILIQQKQATLPIVELKYFWKKHAYKARRIIQGLLVVRANNLEVPEMELKELISYLEEIGSSHATT